MSRAGDLSMRCMYRAQPSTGLIFLTLLSLWGLSAAGSRTLEREPSVSPATPNSVAQAACTSGRIQPDTAACIGHDAISLDEVDLSGGHALHEALEQLYRQRT